MCNKSIKREKRRRIPSQKYQWKVKQADRSSKLQNKVKKSSTLCRPSKWPRNLTYEWPRLWPSSDPSSHINIDFFPPPLPTILQKQNQNNKTKIYSSSINATILYLKTGRIIKTILLLQNYLHESKNITMLFMKTRHTLLKQTPSLLLSLPPWLTSRSNQIPNPRTAL